MIVFLRCARTCGNAVLIALVCTMPATRAGSSNGAAEIASMAVVPGEVTAGGQATGSIRLDAIAPRALVIDVSSANPAVARVPNRVTAPAGAQSASFPVSTTADGPGCTRITAQLGNGVPRSADLFVLPRPSPPLAPVQLRLDSRTVVATGTVVGHVDLPRPAPEGGTTVVLASRTPAIATVPGSILVAPGATSQRFVITTSVAGASTCALISATAGGFTSRALLEIIGISG